MYFRPGKDINMYINHLNKLKSAIEYFEKNKNQSQKNQNVLNQVVSILVWTIYLIKLLFKEELWLQGKLNIDREFDTLLGKFSDNLFSLESDLDNMDESHMSGTKGTKGFFYEFKRDFLFAIIHLTLKRMIWNKWLILSTGLEKLSQIMWKNYMKK